MSYATIEAGWQTLFRALSRFGTRDVTRGDWRVMDRGSGPYVVLYQGRFSAQRSGDWSQVHYSWVTYADVIEKYLDNGTSETNLTASVQDVVDVVGQNPTVGSVNGVTHSEVQVADDVRYFYQVGQRERPSFVLQRITIVTEEDVLYDGSGEFA